MKTYLCERTLVPGEALGNLHMLPSDFDARGIEHRLGKWKGLWKKEQGTSGGRKWREQREEDCRGNGDNPDHRHHWDEEAEGGQEGKEVGNILN